ncbi:Neuronal calcium sensor 1 [Trichoplax sp. H2]|uniref:EF-hand domain-containing protein n=1 Tax=Trichoplax adhaerens TaxID=10228 RepID=B3RNF5_TRIAD|nr:hypothetical protein TRIADDRAFT_20811 [Trichoplax adhaerens]EDV27444.1 hypothetical protein TRIADDRAFT_20811 [Trichoplax adhaerens]RDD44378.1 Neuronal calcium sensor 1 [Trichoplax sp. H2]|eukprot:XP_002109278.1 hypothetical protein TRIADDRAFT_20811 [Trichoplax adhaerens]
MGQTRSKSITKLSPEVLEELEQTTHFSKKEITRWYKDFIKDCPSGQLKQDEFQQIYEQFFPSGDVSKFASFVFNVFDTDKNHFITFAEFLTALSITSRGTVDEKLDWAFSLYDIDHDGFITREEMTAIIDAIYCMVGSTDEMPADDNTPEKRVNRIFSQMDKDNDGRISRDEFATGAKQDSWVVKVLSLDKDDQADCD